MSFGDHLDELRRRILLALAAPLPLSVVTFLFSDALIAWLYRPLDRVLEANELPRRLQVLGPPEFLVTKIKLSVIAALILSGPWIFWQIWQFARPGLYGRERRFVYFLIPGSALLTAAGVALMYFAMLPLMLQVLVVFGTSLQIIPEPVPTNPDPPAAVVEALSMLSVLDAHPAAPAPGDAWIKMPERLLCVAVARPDPEAGGVEILQLPMAGTTMIAQEFRLATYMSFVLVLMLGIVIAFQMPLVILLLGWLGLASPQWLKDRRKYALLVCGVIAAVITPADAISMIAMLLPLYGLFELGILLLVIAPASAVAEGRVFWRRSHKTVTQPDHPRKPAQPHRRPPSSSGADESTTEATDDGDESS